MKTTIAYFFITFLYILPFYGNAQFVNISGNIYSERNGKIVENASVFDNKTNIGTITDKNGFFKLMLNPGVIELVAISDGFKDFKQTVNLTSDTTMVIKLNSVVRFKNKLKDEVVMRDALKPGEGVNTHLK